MAHIIDQRPGLRHRTDGALAPWFDRFADSMRMQGYAHGTICNYLVHIVLFVSMSGLRSGESNFPTCPMNS